MPASQGRPAADFRDLPLFGGAHVQAIRFESALERFDFRAAAEDAPDDWSAATTRMAEVVERAGGIECLGLDELNGCRQEAWPRALERAWQRLMGRRLEELPPPARYNGDLAAAYLLRGGEATLAHRSLERHLRLYPGDSRAWQLFATFEPLRATVRCAFHGGPVLETAAELIALIEEDGLAPIEPWLLSYAWLTRHISLEEIRAALAVDAGMTIAPQTWEPGRSFARHLLDAGGERIEPQSTPPPVLEARRRLKSISEGAFRRYLARV